MKPLAARIGFAALSAAVWFALTRVPFVPIVILGLHGLDAWWSRDHPSTEPWHRVAARELVLGGMWAAVGLLVFRC